MVGYIVGCGGVVQLGGSNTRLFLVGPAKVKARQSIQFIEGSPEVEIKNTCLILLSQFLLSYFASMLQHNGTLRKGKMYSKPEKEYEGGAMT